MTAIVLANLGAWAPVANAEAVRVGGGTRITVGGAPIASITSNPLSLIPAFGRSITDYVLRCGAGINAIDLTLTAVHGGILEIDGRFGHSLTIKVGLVEDQALIVIAKDVAGEHVQYWMRCLPHDFPDLVVVKPGAPAPGWYLTGNINSSQGSGTFAMVLDDNGTPVWYRRTDGQGAVDVTPLSHSEIAWNGFNVRPDGAFEVFNLRTRTTHWLAGPTLPLDFHEIEVMSNGDLMLMASPLKRHVDLSGIGLGWNATILDCVFQEVDSKGRLVWQWRASNHLSPLESTHPLPVRFGHVLAYDLFHCNSLDTNANAGSVLMSSRHTDAIYAIKKATGNIMWKLGGNSGTHDHEKVLVISGDPEGAFHAQHDARFAAGGDISLFDDQTWDPTLAARGVEYHLDLSAGTATLVWSYRSPDGLNSAATGSFRRLNRGNDNVIGWGVKPDTLFSETDASGALLLNVTFPNGEFAYRVIKVPFQWFRHDLLRSSAGLPVFQQAGRAQA